MIKSILKGIFTPAVALMSRLRYWQKFSVFIVLFTIPVSFALYSFIGQINTNIRFTEKEISGSHYIFPVLSLLQDVQQHRGMASLYLRGDTSFLPLLVEKGKKIEEGFALITAANKENTEEQELRQEFGTADMLAALQKKWALLVKNYTQLTPKESARQHTEFISDILDFVYFISDQSNLTLDPAPDSFYLINTMVNTLPNLSENLGQARAFVLSVQDPKKISDVERRDIINYIKIATIAEEKIQRDIRVAFAANPSLQAALDESLNTLSSSIKGFASLLETFVNTNAIEMPLPEYYAFATVVINTNFSFAESLSASLHEILHHRIEEFQSKKRISIGITVFSYALILYVFIGFYLLVARTVRDLKNIAKQLISGRATEVSVLSNDELGEVGKSFNAIGQELIASNNEILANAQDLQKKSDEFEHMNKLMVGRELKMIELKKEIEKYKDTPKTS